MTTIIAPAHTKEYVDQAVASFDKQPTDATWLHTRIQPYESNPLTTTNVVTIIIPPLTTPSVFWTQEMQLMLKARICQSNKENLTNNQQVKKEHF
jgi:hypothetical protein